MRRSRLLAVGSVIGLALGAACSGGRGFWFLSVINGGAVPVEVSVSLAKGSWKIGPGEAKTVKIDGQEDAASGKERTFTVKTGEKPETFTAVVKHPDIMVLDITGQSCVMAVDYGAQYRPKDLQLPEGEGDLRLVQTFQGQRLYAVGRLPSKKNAEGTFITTQLGEKLPEQLERSASSSDIPEHLRLVNVPCNLLNDAKGLYAYLNDH